MSEEKRDGDQGVSIPAEPDAPLTAADSEDDAVDEMERESFPASDPPSTWAGPEPG